MKNILLILFFIAGWVIPTLAQDDVATVLKQINAIKMNPQTYICSESTSAKWDDAYDNAKAMLEIKIEEWAREKSENEDIKGCIAKSKNSILHIQARRGSLYRAFLYVKKSDIMTFSNEKDIVVVPVDDNYGHNPTTTVRHSSTEEIVIDAPTTESPAGKIQVYQPTVEECRILGLKSIDEIMSFIKSNNISQWGKLSTVPTYGEYYVLIFNMQSKEISAYLHHIQGGYLNMKIGSIDYIDNYRKINWGQSGSVSKINKSLCVN